MRLGISVWLIACVWAILTSSAHADTVQVESTKITLQQGGSFAVTVVRIPLTSGEFIPRLVNAKSGVGRTEPFQSMLARTHAVCGINGSFFDAYNVTGDKDPGMTLITGGEIVHKGGTGSVCGFTAQGEAVFGKLDLAIRGTVAAPGRRPKSWYAYWLNRTPTSPDNIVVCTPARGTRARVPDGISVVVKNGAVVRVVPGDTAIPETGFVINFRGDSAPQAANFPLGAVVTFSVIRKPDNDDLRWQQVVEAVGAGPLLVRDGQFVYNPESEGFTSPKILSAASRRCAIGINRKGDALLVCTSGATVAQVARIMLKLGAVQALNLDGGASSGLFASGRMLCEPGRELSNALVFIHKGRR